MVLLLLWPWFEVVEIEPMEREGCVLCVKEEFNKRKHEDLVVWSVRVTLLALLGYYVCLPI